MRIVAIAIPETGLLLEPTRPTIFDETVAKKNPKMTMRMALMIPACIGGRSHIATAITAHPARTNFMSMSFSVRSAPFAADFDKPPSALVNVRTMSGSDFMRLMIPAAASAPAPM